MIKKLLVALVLLLFVQTAQAQFADQATWAGTGGGAANVQTASLGTVTSYADILGVVVKYVPGFSNTGAATLNLNGIGAQPIQRATPAGMAALGGGEIIAGHVAIVIWNGTVFDLQNSAAPDPPGHVMDYAGSVCPTGWTAANAGTVSQTTQAPLYGVLASIWGSNAGGSFTLPDLRGRATFGQDSGGSGRITSAGGNFDGTTIGNTGGQQNKVVAQANLAAFALTVTDPGHSHTVFTNNISNTAGSLPSGVASNGSGDLTSVSTTGITVASGGSGTPLPTLSNAAIVNKCVRF
jgi:microcystin-dependent protein